MESFKETVEFKIIKKIAEGGMGAVYKAIQTGIEGFEKTVAIKTLHSSLSDSDKCVNMFITEAKLVADLVHENIVQIYQFGKNNDSYYVVLEYVDGISLHEFISFHSVVSEKIPEKLAVFIVSRIARGLAYAHSRLDEFGNVRNIVHRDVCPRNIMITTEGLPKLTDFGIAKAKHTTLDNSLSGKPLFMSPEQAAKLPVDFRSDIYSLGVVLFNLISGCTSRKIANGVPDVLRQAKEGFVNWSALPEDVPGEVLAILKKMTAPDPDDRYQDTNDLAKDLEYYIYKDGYGPTIVSLADYMRKQMPYIYSNKSKIGNPETEQTNIKNVTNTETKLNPASAILHETLLMDENGFPQTQGRSLEKTAAFTEIAVESDMEDTEF